MNTETGTLRQIALSGLWSDNPGLVQLLGLCPLLAVSNTVENGLALGFATAVVLTATNCLVSAARGWIRHELRLPAFVLIIAAFVTVVQMLFEAYAFELHLSLGIFIPLIVTNCAILARAEVFASRQPLLPSLIDGLAHGAGFAGVLVVLGGARELLSSGGLQLAGAPPGAFIGLALIIALRNWITARRTNAAGT